MDDVNQEYNKIHSHLNDGSIDIKKLNMSKFTDAQRSHLLLHLKHFGHEGMHAAMLLILILAIALAQIVLIVWKKKHFKSYQNFLLVCMWIVPFLIASYNLWFRFISIWLVITILTSALIYKPLTQRNIQGSTPRLIYKWFFYLYTFSSIITVTGYVIEICTFLGVNMLLGIKPDFLIDVGFMLLFYGVYWGVLCRDFTDFLVGHLAANIGYYSEKSALPSKSLNSNICAICGRSHAGLPDIDKDDFDHLSSCSESSEKVYTLSCGHKFHQYCVFGWSLVGKKQICPYCREKCDIHKLFSSLTFQKPHFLYGNMLDFIRYLIGFQPLIIIIVQVVIHFLGLE